MGCERVRGEVAVGSGDATVLVVVALVVRRGWLAESVILYHMRGGELCIRRKVPRGAPSIYAFRFMPVGLAIRLR